MGRHRRCRVLCRDKTSRFAAAREFHEAIPETPSHRWRASRWPEFRHALESVDVPPHQDGHLNVPRHWRCAGWLPGMANLLRPVLRPGLYEALYLAL